MFFLGSEKVKETKTSGETLVESNNINKSLLTLGIVLASFTISRVLSRVSNLGGQRFVNLTPFPHSIKKLKKDNFFNFSVFLLLKMP